ncbi:hypothetical protein TRVL_00355 [Trypanosoma vivax]|nr:hypothetical protein TRVL_00355 [Trypanosoma vivax]
MYEGWSYERLRQQRNRAHFLLEDCYRFITVILHRGKLYAIDSPCYHASGPLGEGEIVDLEEAHGALTAEDLCRSSEGDKLPLVACLRCPWHGYLISISSGELVEIRQDDGNGRQGRGGSQRAILSYPLQPQVDAPCSGARVSRGRVVQRTHRVSLDETTGILTIEVEDEAEMRKRPVASDRPACNLKTGALTMQIFDIKARGLASDCLPGRDV